MIQEVHERELKHCLSFGLKEKKRQTKTNMTYHTHESRKETEERERSNGLRFERVFIMPKMFECSLKSPVQFRRRWDFQTTFSHSYYKIEIAEKSLGKCQQAQKQMKHLFCYTNINCYMYIEWNPIDCGLFFCGRQHQIDRLPNFGHFNFQFARIYSNNTNQLHADVKQHSSTPT